MNYRASAGAWIIHEFKPAIGREPTASPFIETAQGSVPFKNVIPDNEIARQPTPGGGWLRGVPDRWLDVERCRVARSDGCEAEEALRVGHTDRQGQMALPRIVTDAGVLRCGVQTV